MVDRRKWTGRNAGKDAATVDRQNNRGAVMAKLRELEAVKWVTGTCRLTAKVSRLNAEQIAEIGEVEMHQPYPAEPQTWASLGPTDKYSCVMAIVANEYSERGAVMVADGYCLDSQIDGLAIGYYAQQQQRLASITGECSEGCSIQQTGLRVVYCDGEYVVEHICKHTLRPCRSCHKHPRQRVELLEQLLVSSRKLASTDGNAMDRVKRIVQQIDAT